MRAKELSFEGVVNLAFENNPPSGPNALPHEVQREALAKLERFGRHQFDYIIVDEFHHASAKSYRALIDYFQPKFLLGLTATPERTDGGGLRVLGTRRSALGTRHSVLGTRRSALGTRYCRTTHKCGMATQEARGRTCRVRNL